MKDIEKLTIQVKKVHEIIVSELLSDSRIGKSWAKKFSEKLIWDHLEDLCSDKEKIKIVKIDLLEELKRINDNRKKHKEEKETKKNNDFKYNIVIKKNNCIIETGPSFENKKEALMFIKKMNDNKINYEIDERK